MLKCLEADVDMIESRTEYQEKGSHSINNCVCEHRTQRKMKGSAGGMYSSKKKAGMMQTLSLK